MSLPVAILAGGMATRMRPITETMPKALVEVAGRPFAEHQVERLAAQGISHVVWLVGYRAHQIQDALGDGSRWGMRFEYRHDGPALLGTGGAIGHALPVLGEAFFVMYGDSYLEADFGAVTEVLFEDLGLVRGAEHHMGDARARDPGQQMGQERQPGRREHRLGRRQGERPQPCPFSADQNHRVRACL